MQRRDRGIAQSLGLPLTKRVKESRVLLVGAGGIGCEMLKNLVCCGFGSLPSAQQQATTAGSNGATDPAPTSAQKKAEIVVIDLDTIDLSNLNRQFLFRKQHIKKAKATVAKETASHFNPACNISAHHASIFDSTYTVDFFADFDLVFNALDNLAARRHVNRMCLAAHVPLIESGTTGFNGQVQVIWGGRTECYDCNPKPVQKSFPICTIRSTPSQPIHCIVWAKSYLLPELFGTSEEESAEVAVTGEDNAEEVAKLREEAEALKAVRAVMGKSEFAEEIFNKVFHDDIERLRTMTEMWQSRRAPSSLSFASLWSSESDGDIVRHGQTLSTQDQAVWGLQDSLAVFAYAVDTLSSRCQAGEKVIEFDKDDKDTLDFVAAAANLRSHVFGIPMHSEWEVKQMAGNIIPAIATSNALTASLCVMEGFKILRKSGVEQNGATPYKATSNNHLPTSTSASASNGAVAAVGSAKAKEEPALGGAKMVFLNSRSTERIITTQSLSPPNPECPVCSPVYARLQLPASSPEAATPTLQDLVDLLRENVGYEDLGITTEAGIIYDPDLEDNFEKPLSEYVMLGNSFITVTDEAGDCVDLVLSTTSSADGSAGLRLLPETLSLPRKPKKAVDDAEVDADVDGDGVALGAGTPEPVQAPAPAASSSAGAKRKRDAEEEVEGAKKRAKAGKEEVLVVDDDGAILLDDD